MVRSVVEAPPNVCLAVHVFEFAILSVQSLTAALPLYEVPVIEPLTVCAFATEPALPVMLAFMDVVDTLYAFLFTSNETNPPENGPNIELVAEMSVVEAAAKFCFVVHVLLFAILRAQSLTAALPL